jgi:hypothetical protein
MAKTAVVEPSITWIWLWDALVLLMQYYPRPRAEIILVRAIAEGRVRRKRFPRTDSDGHDMRIWRRLLNGGDEPEMWYAQVHWEESGIEGNWRLLPRSFRIRVVQGDVQRLLPDEARLWLPEVHPVRHLTAVEWITREAQMLNRQSKIPIGINKTNFSKLLANNMRNAPGKDPSISVNPVKWEYIRNHLSEWDLWPISIIE